MDETILDPIRWSKLYGRLEAPITRLNSCIETLKWQSSRCVILKWTRWLPIHFDSQNCMWDRRCPEWDSNLVLKLQNDNLHDLQFQNGWDDSRSDPTMKIVCEIGGAHNGTQLLFWNLEMTIFTIRNSKMDETTPNPIWLSKLYMRSEVPIMEHNSCFETLKWQSSRFAIPKWMRRFLIRSNCQNCMGDWRRPYIMRLNSCYETLKWQSSRFAIPNWMRWFSIQSNAIRRSKLSGRLEAPITGLDTFVDQRAQQIWVSLLRLDQQHSLARISVLQFLHNNGLEPIIAACSFLQCWNRSVSSILRILHF